LDLLDYYLGSSGGELLLEEITKIGEEILPYLIQKKSLPLECRKRFKHLCYENLEARNVKIDIAIKAIKRGLVLYAVYPDEIEIKAEQEIGIIKIFLEDYRSDKSSYPSSLNLLKDYAWHKYGYKLVIYNQWGNIFEYSLKKNAYSLGIGADL